MALGLFAMHAGWSRHWVGVGWLHSRMDLRAGGVCVGGSFAGVHSEPPGGSLGFGGVTFIEFLEFFWTGCILFYQS